MKRKLALLLVLAILSMMGAAALAVVKPGEDFCYLDTANVLSEEAEGTIYFCNQLLEEACGGQIVVAALDSIGNADIYDYAYDMFNEWKIGSPSEQNGFLLLLAIEEDNYYAMTGDRLDGVFSSSELNRLFDNYLEADFAAKDYEAGALKFFEAVLEKYIDRYNLDFSYADGVRMAQEALAGGSMGFGGAQSGGESYGSASPHDPYVEEDDGISGWLIAIIIIVVILAVMGTNNRRRGGSFWVFTAPRRHYHHPHHAPHHHPVPPPHSHNRRPPGGFGGFGGGRSGGGFSSGRSSSGRSSFGGGRSGSGRSGFSGSFGGGRGGGGRSSGGGAGRGRH